MLSHLFYSCVLFSLYCPSILGVKVIITLTKLTLIFLWSPPSLYDNKAGTAACDPGNGTAQQTYGYWSNAAHITCDWNCNVSNPTPQHHFTGQDWEFCIDVQNAGNPMSETVTITICEECTE